MNYHRFATILFILTSHWLIAQSQTISGFVREAATGEPLSYVNVFIKDSYYGSTTNLDGYYVITDVPQGEYEVAASMIGYQIQTIKVTIRSGDNVRIDFRLETTVIQGEEINVTAERQKFKDMVQMSTITLDMREIQLAPAFVEADVFRTIQLLPGVQTLNDFSSALYVRGSTPDQNLIMLDGITVYNPFHLGGVFSTFNTDAIKEAEFFSGGFPARYGGRMGSILNIINREGNTEEYHGIANISLLSSKALFEGPIPSWTGMKGSFMLASRRTYLDAIVDAFAKIYQNRIENLDEDQYVGFPYHFYDLESKINLDWGKNHRITLSSFYGDDILNFDFLEKSEWEEPEDDYYERYQDDLLFDWRWGNFTNSLTWRWIYSPKLVIKTFLAASRFRFRIDMNMKRQGTINEGNEVTKWQNNFYFDVFDIVQDRTVETEVTWKPNSQHTLIGGFQHKYLSFNLGMTFEWSLLDEDIFETDRDTALWMESKPFEQALYLQDKWNLTPLFSSQVGLRISNYSLHNTLYLDPRIGLKYLVTENLSLKATWGRYHQFLATANPQDENFRFIDIWLGIPKDRPAPYSDHTILGIEYLSPQNVLFRVEGYYKDFHKLITLKQGDMFAEEEGEIRFDPFNEFWDTKAYAYGLELLAKKTVGTINGWIGYTFARTRWKTEVHGWYSPRYDRKHTLNIVANGRLSERTHISSAISYSSGNPYTPIIGRIEYWEEEEPYYNSGSWWFSNDQFLVGKKNSDRLPTYFRWDVSIIRRKPFLGGYREMYLQIINLTNHLNHLMYFYDQKYNRRSGEYEGVRRRGVPMFPFLPTFGIRLEF